MANRRSFVDMLQEEQTSFGTVSLSGSPNMAEALCQTSLDFLMFDRQHSNPDLETLENLMRAADLHDVPVIVRVPRDDTSLVTNLLDMGAAGIMLPQVGSSDVIKEVLSHVRFERGRSFASLTRAGDFGDCDTDNYVEHVNNQLAIIPQIESEAGVRNVDQIAQTKGVSAIAVGPTDLSLAMDVSRDSDAFEEAVETVFKAAHSHGCGNGMFVGSKENIRQFTDRCTFVIYGSDIRLLPTHINRVLDRM